MTARIADLSMRTCALALLILVSACGGSRSGSPTPYEDPHPLPEEPLVVDMPEIGAHGGRFVIAQSAGPRTFNMMMANETSSTDVTKNMFVGLAGFDNITQRDVPLLAKSWEVADDGLTWTFHLRRGARFSDGTPITSADVLFSFDLAYDDVLHPSIQDLLIMNGKRWDLSAPDDYTVVIKTPEPNAMAVSLASAVYIMPKHALEGAFKAGTFASAYGVSTPPDQLVVSGPFRLVSYTANERVVLGRNPYWFGVDSRQQRLPYLDELVFTVVPDQDAADLQFRAGQLDGLDNVKPENYAWYEENQSQGNFTLHNLGPSLNTNFFWFNLGKVRTPSPGKRVGEPHVGAAKYAIFNNRDFRRAVSLAVDREAMIRSIYFGDAVKNWSVQTAGSVLWHSADVHHDDFNPDEARRLLAGLGWTDRNGDGFLEDQAGNMIGFTLKTNSDNRLRVAMANFIRDDLAKVGIRVTLAPIDFNTLVVNLRDDYQYEAALLGLQTGVPPDPAMGQNVYRSSGRTHYWNPQQPKPETPQEARIDQLMDVIVGNPELAVRQTAWKEVERLINEQAWIVWLPTPLTKLPLSNRFGNLQPSPIPHRLIWNADRIFLKARAGQN